MKLERMIDNWVVESGLRVGVLAERLDVSRHTVYKWMRGDSRPTLSNLDRLGTELGKGAREKNAAIAALLEAQTA